MTGNDPDSEISRRAASWAWTDPGCYYADYAKLKLLRLLLCTGSRDFRP